MVMQRLRQDVDRAAEGAQPRQDRPRPADRDGAVMRLRQHREGQDETLRLLHHRAGPEAIVGEPFPRLASPFDQARCVTRDPAAPPKPAALLKRTT